MKKEETKKLLTTIDDSFFTADKVEESMIKQFLEGKEPGSKTYVRDIDSIRFKNYNTKAWSWRRGEFNIWTGYNNEGKSLALIYLCLLKALNEDKKFALFSPENFPPDDFYDDLIHMLTGKTTDRKSPKFNMTEKEYIKALNVIKKYFFFVYPQNDGKIDFTIEKIEDVFEYLIWEYDIFGVAVDPYIKIRHQMLPGEPEHLYASRFTMDRVNFTRKNDVSYNLVMHQTTPTKDKNTGNYPKPNLYSIKGGGTWADSVDNVISIWRPNRGSDPTDTQVQFISEKIKKQRLVGIPSVVDMNFDRDKNRYLGMDGYDYLDGSIIKQHAPEIYRPTQFPTVKNDFDQAPF